MYVKFSGDYLKKLNRLRIITKEISPISAIEKAIDYFLDDTYQENGAEIQPKDIMFYQTKTTKEEF